MEEPEFFTRRTFSVNRKLLILLCIMLLPLWALAELPEPFTGYFEKVMFLRPAPAASSDSLATIPEGTPLLLEPVNERFARATYQGKTGYVYYAEVKPMPQERKVEPYPAYLPQNKYLFALPMDNAEVLMTVQAETPVTVTARTDRFLRIETGGKAGYVYDRDVQDIGDMAMDAAKAEFYADRAVTARQYPLRHAAKVLSIEPNRVYIAEAVCNGYYRITVGDDVVYVPVGEVESIRRGKDSARAAIITPETELFTAPALSAAADRRLPETQLFLLGPITNGFQRLGSADVYVRANDVTSYAVGAIEDQFLQITEEAPLLLHPEDGAEETASVTAGQLMDVAYATEQWYLLEVGGRWGFLKKDTSAVPLAIDLQMTTTAAVLSEDASVFTGGSEKACRAGLRLHVTASAGDYYRIDLDGRAGYVLKEAVQLLGTDTELAAYTATAPADIAMMDFPDAALSSVIGTIPAGGQMRVTGFNRCYLIVKWNGMTGYVRQEGLLTAETRGMPETEDAPAYELVLDKSTGMTYAFRLTETGEYGELVICAQVGTGKRTTPTPSGTFLLGRKERWHAFTLSYTPHTTEYVKARYIHGWPCEKKSVGTVMTGLIQTGMVTGGCLRSPFEFARWVYLNCPSYQTKLVIVSGGFEAPANAQSVRVR
ncbi:MAG: hypothetical protein E7327_07120 [Clostridiales bacterium]|nr:hypothetical protein [Clostridiales bacterium]